MRPLQEIRYVLTNYYIVVWVPLSRWIAPSCIDAANLNIWHWMKMLKLVRYCNYNIVTLVKSSWSCQGRWTSRDAPGEDLKPVETCSQLKSGCSLSRPGISQLAAPAQYQPSPILSSWTCSFNCGCIPHNCCGRHGRCPCRFFLPGVIFSRLNAKNLPFYSIIWHTVFNATPCDDSDSLCVIYTTFGV